MPEELLESELFGHEKGAFTDARQQKAGKIEMADGGSLYFDQVQDLSLPLQAKLLRVVEEKRFERVGGTRTLEVDVRFVASVNVDLQEAVSAGRFREDLFHRLNVVPLTLPPLRNRREDILPLAHLFLERERERRTTTATSFDAATAEALRGYHWPGNVRELRSVVERAALLCPSEAIHRRRAPRAAPRAPATLWAGRDRRPSLKDVEQTYIRYVLDQVGGSQTRAAVHPGHQPQGALGEAPALRDSLRAEGTNGMDQKTQKSFREKLVRKKKEILEAHAKTQTARPGGRPGRRAGRGGHGGELLRQGVPVQPVERRGQPPPARGRGPGPAARQALRGVCLLRGRDEPEAPRGRALGPALPALPGDAGAGTPLSHLPPWPDSPRPR